MKFPPLGLLVIVYCAAILLTVQTENHVTPTFTWKTKKKKKFEKFDKPLQYIHLHKEMRTPDDLTAPSYRHGYRLSQLLQAERRGARRSASARTKETVEFIERGPGNVPGRTRALLDLSSKVPSGFLAGAATGGIWKTSDAGVTWNEKNANLSTIPISSFASGKNLGRIYAGTGEFVSSIFSASGDGILVSTDLGENWNVLPSTQGNPDFTIVTRLIVDPDNEDVVLCTTAPSNLESNPTRSGIMRSTDGGTTWIKVLETKNPLEQIIATPGNFQLLYATENSVGVWKSVDGGLTWLPSKQGMYPEGRIELAISPVNTNRIFASAEGSVSGHESDLYMSSDAGQTWDLAILKYNGRDIDFLGNDPASQDSQGFYDNTIMCDPFNEFSVYVGGISLFQFTVSEAGEAIQKYTIAEENTSFLFLQSFSNFSDDLGRLQVGPYANSRTVEVRFGVDKKQKAHRFTVPVSSTSGVPVTQYSYQDYIDVPFEVWDLSSNRQLMVSFRDQNRNGVFDLVPQYLTSGETDYLTNSREYLFFHDEQYQTEATIAGIATTGGSEYRLMYSIFPALAENANWDAANLPESRLEIHTRTLNVWKTNTLTVADSYGNFDSKNIMDQENLDAGVHPDHHCMIPFAVNTGDKTWQIILGNDGGVFVSERGTVPGTSAGGWAFRGMGYNTSQFYGADKRPGYDEYIGGLQDNGTRISPKGQSADATTEYLYAIGGDGFEVLWHNRRETHILGSVYYGNIFLSTDGGESWDPSIDGISPGPEFPFVTKLAHSKDFPERVFTVSARGVHVSQNFGKRWTLTPIDERFVTNSVTMLDVEVSRANADVVWAGSGMSNQPGNERNIFLSRDAGKTFTPTTNFNDVVLGSITKLASHPTDAATAYALFSFSGRPKIMRTTNWGESWKDISGFGTGDESINGFPDVAVYSLYVRPDAPWILWAGTEIGIFESLDDGMTWNVLTDFPRVAVWDMKGQDDQVVIATHGRGIWTASLQKQSNLNPPAEIVALGTTPSGKLAFRINIPENIDSVEFMVGLNRRSTIHNVPSGIQEQFLAGVSSGIHSVYLISYRNGAPFQSSFKTVNHIDVLEPKKSHSTYFRNLAGFSLSGFSLQGFTDSYSTERKGLHTPHPYEADASYTARLMHPVIVGSTLPFVYYNEVAIVEPANDYVVLEATRNGLDWIPVTTPYDASRAPAWQSAYTSGQPASKSFLVQHEGDLRKAGVPNDTLLLQWRLHSGANATSWGWAIDYISIQEVPVATESAVTKNGLSLYPNPATREACLDYVIQTRTSTVITLHDVFGKEILNVDRGIQLPGKYAQKFDLIHVAPGSYFVVLKTDSRKEVFKLIVRK